MALSARLAAVLLCRLELTARSLARPRVCDNSGNTSSALLGKSLVNSLVIVAVLAVATTLIVLLYKFRCMRCLLGYMMLSSVSLLGLMGGLVFLTMCCSFGTRDTRALHALLRATPCVQALDMWQIPMDMFTFIMCLWNFAAVGVIAIFYQKGLPTVVTQAYLVATSVIMAWQLSRFDEWTGWALLVVLAMYDLCAVLSPCGPLKALVNLMQEYNEPMPGLLYEAELPRPVAARAAAAAAASQATSTRGASSAGARLASEDPQDYDVGPGVGLMASAVVLMLNEEGAAEAPRQGGDSGGGTGGDAHRRESGGAGAGREGGHAHEEEERNIKLGLGDFVFYSVLVSKAGLYSFTAFVSCLCAVLCGLMATLVLLSLHKAALPALPISIALGVATYFVTRFAMQPALVHLGSQGLYV
ncbi:presenilin [Tribonema minus]|uniref:Presenilin n=1 Tax=Tribonema minus TaxID=303371 RepID=A0A835ZDC4_9STRA|nr:presenilin [Tribonema minus]